MKNIDESFIVEEGLNYGEKKMLELVEQCIDKTKFAKNFFPKHFGDPFAPFHMEIHELAEQYKYLSIAAPRGHAKTTSFTFLKILHVIAYRLSKFVVIVSDTYEQACLFLENIRHELDSNISFKQVYNLKMNKEGKDTLIVNEECMIKAMGSGQKFRGIKFRQHRPDLIICDDIENDEMVENVARRDKMRRWFFGALRPALDKKSGHMIVIGTILHEDGLLARLMKDPEFYSKLYQIIGDDNKPLWSALYTMKDIAKMREDYEKRKQLTVFYQEFFNVASAPENRKFQLSWLRYYKLEHIDRPGYLRSWFRFIIVDLAHEEEMDIDNSYHVVMAAAYNPDTDERYILDYKDFQGDFDEVTKAFFEMANTWSIKRAGIEVVGAQKHFYQHVRNEVRKRGLNIKLDKLTHTKSKIYRIMTLQYPMQIGKYKIMRWMSKFETELTSFPRGETMDVIDTAAMIEEEIDIAGVIKRAKSPGDDGYFDERLKGRFKLLDSRTKSGGKNNVTGY